MSESEKRVSVIDDPTAKRTVIAGAPFSTPQLLAAAIEWLMSAPQLDTAHTQSGQPSKQRVGLNIGATGDRGVAELVYYRRASDPEARGGGFPDFAFVLVISATG